MGITTTRSSPRRSPASIPTLTITFSKPITFEWQKNAVIRIMIMIIMVIIMTTMIMMILVIMIINVFHNLHFAREGARRSTKMCTRTVLLLEDLPQGPRILPPVGNYQGYGYWIRLAFGLPLYKWPQ